MPTPLPSCEKHTQGGQVPSSHFLDFLCDLIPLSPWAWVLSRMEEGALLDKGCSWLLRLAAVGSCCQYRILLNRVACVGSRSSTDLLLQISPELTLFGCVDSNLKPIHEATGSKRSHHGTGKSRVSLPWFVRLRVLAPDLAFLWGVGTVGRWPCGLVLIE